MTQVVRSQRAAARTLAGERRTELVRELLRRLRTGGARRAEARPAAPLRDAGGRSAPPPLTAAPPIDRPRPAPGARAVQGAVNDERPASSPAARAWDEVGGQSSGTTGGQMVLTVFLVAAIWSLGGVQETASAGREVGGVALGGLDRLGLVIELADRVRHHRLEPDGRLLVLARTRADARGADPPGAAEAAPAP